jgi:hypothetical protein
VVPGAGPALPRLQSRSRPMVPDPRPRSVLTRRSYWTRSRSWEILQDHPIKIPADQLWQTFRLHCEYSTSGSATWPKGTGKERSTTSRGARAHSSSTHCLILQWHSNGPHEFWCFIACAGPKKSSILPPTSNQNLKSITVLDWNTVHEILKAAIVDLDRYGVVGDSAYHFESPAASGSHAF